MVIFEQANKNTGMKAHDISAKVLTSIEKPYLMCILRYHVQYFDPSKRHVMPADSAVVRTTSLLFQYWKKTPCEDLSPSVAICHPVSHNVATILAPYNFIKTMTVPHSAFL